MKEIEVSAIMEGDGFYHTLAITPCGIVFVWRKKKWQRLFSVIGTDLQYWTRRAYCGTNRRIYRGIFKIKVAGNG